MVTLGDDTNTRCRNVPAGFAEEPWPAAGDRSASRTWRANAPRGHRRTWSDLASINARQRRRFSRGGGFMCAWRKLAFSPVGRTLGGILGQDLEHGFASRTGSCRKSVRAANTRSSTGHVFKRPDAKRLSGGATTRRFHAPSLIPGHSFAAHEPPRRAPAHDLQLSPTCPHDGNNKRNPSHPREFHDRKHHCTHSLRHANETAVKAMYRAMNRNRNPAPGTLCHETCTPVSPKRKVPLTTSDQVFIPRIAPGAIR